MSNEIERLRADVENLRAFAQACLGDWPDVGMDGFELQESGLACGLLSRHIVTEPCGDECNCVQDDMSEGVECYRKTPLLTGATVRRGGQWTPT